MLIFKNFNATVRIEMARIAILSPAWRLAISTQPEQATSLVTIKHIAQQLGVAASTVARALSHDVRISPGTRAKVV